MRSRCSPVSDVQGYHVFCAQIFLGQGTPKSKLGAWTYFRDPQTGKHYRFTGLLKYLTYMCNCFSLTCTCYCGEHNKNVLKYTNYPIVTDCMQLLNPQTLKVQRYSVGWMPFNVFTRHSWEKLGLEAAGIRSAARRLLLYNPLQGNLPRWPAVSSAT